MIMSVDGYDDFGRTDDQSSDDFDVENGGKIRAFFTLLPNTLQGVKVNFYTITLFHHEYFPFLFLVLHLFL